MISALIGCTNTVTIRIAKHMKLDFELVRIDAEGIFGLAEDIEVLFPEIALMTTAKADALQKQLWEMQQKLSIFYCGSRISQAAGTKVKEKWNIVD
ncbi:MAG: hypothetical protein CMM26_13045 [Rhodospirillaceae bacterium]|nr:hypothetical protein [Rhodospirillaceae bacterium]|tara:strand:- start:260 stop:547 length:288 start_codon:yes stop_codon:yes gene_type:complete